MIHDSRGRADPPSVDAKWLRNAVLPLAAVVIAGRFLMFSRDVLTEFSCRLPDGSTTPSLFDDAMISLRVEGYTNFLWVLIMAPFTAFLSKADAVVGVQILSVGLLLCCAALSGKLVSALATTSRHPPANWERHLISVVGGALVLGYFPFIRWGLLGMEVPLLGCFLVGATLAAIKPPTRASMLGQSLLLGGAYLTRPDAIVPAVILVGYSVSRLAPRLRKGPPPPRLLEASSRAWPDHCSSQARGISRFGSCTMARWSPIPTR